MQDVILAKKGVKTSNEQSENYDGRAQRPPDPGHHPGRCRTRIQRGERELRAVQEEAAEVPVRQYSPRVVRGCHPEQPKRRSSSQRRDRSARACRSSCSATSTRILRIRRRPRPRTTRSSATSTTRMAGSRTSASRRTRAAGPRRCSMTHRPRSGRGSTTCLAARGSRRCRRSSSAPTRGCGPTPACGRRITAASSRPSRSASNLRMGNSSGGRPHGSARPTVLIDSRR